LQWEDQELALLSACSSLIAIVQAGGSRVVQFSHFSVKEFLTSPRLATASGEVSDYHINLDPAHTILAQACLGVLLQTQDDVEGHTPEDHPLARYAAEHWTTHAQFGEVSSRLQKGMEYLFDPSKPHFKVWLTIYDIDRPDGPNNKSTFHWFVLDDKSPAAPLYYAALCGFHNLVKHLMAKYSWDVNAHGGYYVGPLVAALVGEHFQTADLLRLNGADPNVLGYEKCTPLLAAVNCFHGCGNLEVTLKLIEYGADINAKDTYGSTPLHWASRGHHFEDGSVLRLLLKHGGDVNARNTDGFTPLHEASCCGGLEVVPILLKHGADIEAEGSDGKTALQVAAVEGHDEVVRLLLKHGANVEAEDSDGKTALQVAAEEGHDEVVKLLREHGVK
jgi:ankyrin repeat protein